MLNKLKILLKFPMNIIILIVASIKVKFKIKINETDYQSLLNAFLVSGGWFNSLLSKINKNPNLLKFNNTEIEKKSRDITNKIINDGFFIERNFLNYMDIEKLIEFALNSEGFYVMDDINKKFQDQNKFDRKKPIATTYIINENLLLNFSIVQKIIMNPLILSVAQNYFKSKPILAAANMWWSTSFKKKADSASAQMYHFDLDGTKWLKFFIYLTDVNPLNGPHVFVLKTHKNNGIPWKFRSRGYQRISDEEINSFYGEDKICELLGNKGDLIIEDSRGFHKGKHLKKNDRLILEIQFTDTLLFKKEKELNLHTYDKNFKEFVKQNHEIFDLTNLK